MPCMYVCMYVWPEARWWQWAQDLFYARQTWSHSARSLETKSSCIHTYIHTYIYTIDNLSKRERQGILSKVPMWVQCRRQRGWRCMCEIAQSLTFKERLQRTLHTYIHTYIHTNHAHYTPFRCNYASLHRNRTSAPSMERRTSREKTHENLSLSLASSGNASNVCFFRIGNTHSYIHTYIDRYSTYITVYKQKLEYSKALWLHIQ